jgi:hypothetical protein
MKKIIVILSLLTFFSCASRPLKPEVMQGKLGRGMSVADVLVTLGLPNQRQPETSLPAQLFYNGYLLNFTEQKLDTLGMTSGSQSEKLDLKSIQEIRPNYKLDDLSLDKDLVLEVSPFFVADYLNDETLFLKAVAAGINRDGYTMKSNALCVAMTNGFVKGAQAVVTAGYNPHVKLRSDRGGYISPEACLSSQKDLALAEQLKKIIDSKQEFEATKPASTLRESNSESEVPKKNLGFDINWEAVKEFLKPNVPPRASNFKDKEVQPEAAEIPKAPEPSNEK